MKATSQTFSKFERELLKTAYHASIEGSDDLSVSQLCERMETTIQSGWGAQALANFERIGLVKSIYGAAGIEGDMVIGMTGRGMKQAEEWIEEDRKRTLVENLRAIQRSEWIAFSALIVSAIALFKD